MNRKLTAIVDRFNDRAPIGTPVVYRDDLGKIIATHTRSAAWVLSGHTPVILLEGLSGCRLLTRVTHPPRHKGARSA